METLAYPSMPGGMIDIHAHIGINLWRYIRGYADALTPLDALMSATSRNGVAYMAVMPEVNTLYYDPRALVTRLVLVPTHIGDFPYQVENQHVLDVCSGHTQCLPFLNFTPVEFVREQVTWMAEHFGQQRFYGIKVHTLAMHCTLGSLLRTPDVFAFAEDNGLAIMLHGEIRDEAAFAITELEALLGTYPRVNFCVAHLGMFGTAFWNLFGERPDNLYSDTSPFLTLCANAAQGVYPVERIIRADFERPAAVIEKYLAVNADHLLFGSDFPYCGQGYQNEVDFVRGLGVDMVQRLSILNPRQYLRQILA